MRRRLFSLIINWTVSVQNKAQEEPGWAFSFLITIIIGCSPTACAANINRTLKNERSFTGDRKLEWNNRDFEEHFDHNICFSHFPCCSLETTRIAWQCWKREKRGAIVWPLSERMLSEGDGCFSVCSTCSLLLDSYSRASWSFLLAFFSFFRRFWMIAEVGREQQWQRSEQRPKLAAPYLRLKSDYWDNKLFFF